MPTTDFKKASSDELVSQLGKTNPHRQKAAAELQRRAELADKIKNPKGGIRKEETVNEDSYDIQLDKLIGDHKGSLSDADFNAHLEKNKNKGALWSAKMKQTYEKRKKADPEKEMDTRRLARKGIEEGGLEYAEYIETLKDSVAFKVVSLLTCSSDEQKIGRFLEAYKLDLSNYNSFHLTETFKSFE